MNTERIKSISIIAIGALAAGIILLASVRYVLPVLAPFIIAWLVAEVTNRPARHIADFIRLPVGITRLLLSILLIFAVATAVGGIVWVITDAVWSFLSEIGEGDRFYELLSAITEPGRALFGDSLPAELGEKISQAIESVLSQALSILASGATSLVSALPETFLFLLVTVISLVYFSLDYDKIGAFFSRLLPDRLFSKATSIKDGVLTVIRKYVCSYSLILVITFTTMLLGFLALGVKHALIIALIVALLDILPIIGVGTVLIPWGVFSLISGDRVMGIGLIVLFVINAVIRQLAEPKIVAKNLNMHPVATLIMLYVGYALFGIIGIIVVPVTVVCIGTLLNGDKTAEIA